MAKGKLPADVVEACRQSGQNPDTLMDWRVGDEFVSIINAQGQKYVFEIIKLNPEPVEVVKPAAKRGRR